MSGDNYPSQTARRLVARIERLTVRDADRIIVTADGAARSLQATYPEVGAAKYVTISNGYDEAAFRDAEAGLNKVAAGDRIELLHSGLLYPAERDPRPFLNALRRILDDGRIDARRIHVKLRACGYEGEYRPLVRQLALDNVVTFAPAQPYAEALREMLSADGLILFQGSICNGQVPAKLYEYLRTGRPILALTDPAGDTAEVLRRCGIDRIYRMESEEEVTRGLAEFLAAINSRAFVPDDAEVRRYSRTEQAQRLATLLDRVVAASQ
jgi:glycosyltransferase involved in cell wall biosynthesis